MKKIKNLTNIGKINLDEIDVSDTSISVIVTIDELSEDIKRKIPEAITKQIEEFNSLYSIKWTTEKPIIDCMYLSMNFDKQSENYNLYISFYGERNPKLEDTTEIEFELTETDRATLKKAILTKLIDNFF